MSDSDPPIIVSGVPISNNDINHNYNQPVMIEVNEISDAGWMCLIMGCFFCPGFNLLGLCMTERRFVPVYDVQYVY